MQKKLSDYLVITLKGMAMGAADVVPGVSGGTIAFISGIYDELIDSINALNFGLLRVVKTKGLKAAWVKVNGNFLFSLLLGIVISVFSLAKLLSSLLITYPILVWAFFFGLVLASIFFVGKQLKKWNVSLVLSLLAGSVISFLITQIPASTGANPSALYLVLSGALAICAMILPGISGSFILVLLGVYQVVLTAIHQRDIAKIALLAAGAVIGLLSFAKILKYIFTHYKEVTLAVLTGFLVGALYKIWPWKQIIETATIEGKIIVIKEKSISPFSFQGDNLLLYALLCALSGFLLLLIFERWGVKTAK